MTQKKIKRFNVDGLVPSMWEQVLGNVDGRLNTWAVFWYATIMEHNGLCLAPSLSLVRNIGMDGSGVNCGKTDQETITTSIDHRISIFPNEIAIDEKEFAEIKNFYRYIYRKERIKRKIKKFLPENLFLLYRRIKKKL